MDINLFLFMNNDKTARKNKNNNIWIIYSSCKTQDFLLKKINNTKKKYIKINQK